jgi:hypothetical protein
MIVKPHVWDGQVPRQQMPGDILAAGEQIRASDTTVNLTLTAGILTYPIILRAPASASTDTFDTAANIVAGLMAGLGNVGIPIGTTFRVRVVNTGAGAITLAATANTGVTVNRPAIAASAMKDLLLTVNNGTPAQTYQMNTVNGSAVINGLSTAQAATLSTGMVVTNSVNGLQGTTVLAVNISAGSVTLSGNASATSTTPVAVSFSPVVTVDGLAP